VTATRPEFRRTDRTDAPNYLSAYTARKEREALAPPDTTDPGAPSDTPLYLRRFRDRQEGTSASRPALLEVDGERFTSQYAQGTRSHEIIPPPERREVDGYVSEIRIIRHGITQGYSTDAGLTPMGGWQAHQRGHALAKTLRAWPAMRIVCADTARARQTARPPTRSIAGCSTASTSSAASARSSGRTRSPSSATSRCGPRRARATSPRRSGSTRR
jgi:hypothetical protein